jgi:hypothetical protein
MSKSPTFSARLNSVDRENLRKLAKVLGRSQVDTVRFVVRESLKAFQEPNVSSHPAQVLELAQV